MAIRTSVERRRVFDSICEIRGTRLAPWEGVDGWSAERVARTACRLVSWKHYDNEILGGLTGVLIVRASMMEMCVWAVRCRVEWIELM